MIQEERKKDFLQYITACNDKYQNTKSLKNYYNALVRDQALIDFGNRTSPWDFESEIEFEFVRETTLTLQNIDGDTKQGVNWYSQYLSDYRFKKLLEWFVLTLKINNGVVTGTPIYGVGYKGHRIRNNYKNLRSYIGYYDTFHKKIYFDLDCCLRADVPHGPANYIHLTMTWINIIAEFQKTEKGYDPIGLKISIKPDNKILRESKVYTTQQLGLFDNSAPSAELKHFFDEYKHEILIYNEEKKPMTQSEVQNQKIIPTFELNTILFGPPGTGKTYNTVKRAVEIIEKGEFEDDGYECIKARYDRLVKEGRIAFTTFHQSYGYEEFIEGIKPDFEADEIKYQRTDGVFKAFCDKARKLNSNIAQKYEITESSVVWKMSLGRSDDPQIKKDCFAYDRIRLGWGASFDPQQAEITEYVGEGKRIVNAFLNEMKKGDIVFSFLSATTIDAIGVILEDEARYGEWDSYKWYRKVYWLKKGVNVDISSLNDNKRMVQPTLYKLGIAIDSVLSLLKDTNTNKTEDFDYNTPYVFIIDEINRGNVSKIFGELITLIEPSKRLGNPEAMTARLPYSGKDFGVPKNVYILGTMNTADRSLVQLDTALRRRFSFEEMMPDYEVIKEKVGVVEGIDIAKLLRTINDRITALLDREHQIGHSYFLGVKSVKDLAEVFKKKIVPLLQEYFFDDYQSIKDILNGLFVTDKTIQVGGKQKTLYEIHVTENVGDYLKIYPQPNTNENTTEQNAA